MDKIRWRKQETGNQNEETRWRKLDGGIDIYKKQERGNQIEETKQRK